jgi:hypothetical protein
VPIINLQMSQAESGRIRLGVKVPVGDRGKTRPGKLDRFRFTSPRKNLIEKIAELYGGKVEEWQPPRGAGQWQVITNATDIPVVVPPQDPAESQWLELWSAGGCQRRCDGVTEKISGQPCVCDPDPSQRDCKMHTRLRVMLEDVPGLGAWRVDTGSYYAATELPGVAQLLAQAQGAIPGRLVLDQRTVVRDGKTKNFVVPVLDCTEITPKELMSGRVQELMAARAAGAIAGRLREAAAITAGPSKDYPSLIDAAKNRDALTDLYKQAVQDYQGNVPQELVDQFTIRAKAVEPVQGQAQPTAAPAPATSDDPVGELWMQILAESPWDDADELERHFRELVGHSSEEASLEDTTRFLAAIRQAKVKGAAA